MANYPTKNLRQSHSFHKAENNDLIVLGDDQPSASARNAQAAHHGHRHGAAGACSARTILYCSVLYCDVMYWNVLYCTVL